MFARSIVPRFIALALVGATTLAGTTFANGDEPRAKVLFGGEKLPSTGTPHSYGFYSKGCLSGGVAIATDGPTWQAMRLSRNRRWGHPAMIRLIERLSRDAVQDGWPGLLLGDISQPRGGPMLDGHASHQIGLDADIWLTPMPDRKLSATDREKMEPITLVDPKTHLVKDRLWTPAHMRLLKRAASYPEVERIFVNPGIKKKLCDTVKGDRSWLHKVRPMWGHDYHFHVRIACQPGSEGCQPQRETGNDDGCGKPLAWWFTEEPWRPNLNPDAPKARDLMTMKVLPKECRQVLIAPSPVSALAATMGTDGRLAAGSAAAASVATPSMPAGAPDDVPDDVAPQMQAAPSPAKGAPLSAFSPTPEMGVPLPRSKPKS